MRISVVIPCYNAGPWIGDTLRSVAGQSYQPHEVIVVDDGSTDDSVEQVESSGVLVRLIRTVRANGAGARNAGIEAATGDWIAFLDADDVWCQDHLERACRLVAGGDDVAYMCHSKTAYGNRADVVEGPLPWSLTQPTPGLSHWDYLNMTSRRFFFAMSACLIRRDVLLAIGGLDTSQVRRHDIDMWLRAIRGHTWSYDPVATSVYRVDTPGAISRNIANREYYFLRVFLKNRDAYRSEALTYLTRVAARRTMSSAYTDGDRDDRRRAMELAWPNLRARHKVLYSLVRLCPALFRWANRLRRQVVLNRG